MKEFVSLLALFVLLSCGQDENQGHSLKLWYDEPAEKWVEALPVGNGRLGAMVYGETETEIIQFNEETLWTGHPHDYSHKGAYKYLDSLRQLLWDGKQKEAHGLGNREFMSQPLGQLSYQPFGNIVLSFPGHKNVDGYKRGLDIENAIATVNYKVGEDSYRREVFSSNPGQAIIINLASDTEAKLSFKARLDTPHDISECSIENNVLVLKGKVNDYPNGKIRAGGGYPESKVEFEAKLLILENDGQEVIHGAELIIKDASNVTLALVGASNFVNYNDLSGNPGESNNKYISALRSKTYKTLREEHIADYQGIFNRLEIDLGASEISARPTDERLNTFYADEDPDLVALLYQYGRYLLISSSREGTQPANLQGIWNDLLAPPWDSKYTININAEMNYWPAEITNLTECAGPVLQMVDDLSKTGQLVAKEHYNLEGWVAHHNTDIWRGAAPINNANHGIWVTGGAWLCQHLWWHYQFTGDVEFLKNKAYPVLKEASRFFTGYLVDAPCHKGWLISGPSNSPENGGLVMGPTMDHQVIRNLFSNTIEAAGILGLDEEFIIELKKLRARIAPNQIGKYGQLQEWLEDIDDPGNKHRHVSHLWGLHPGNEIHPLTTPELAKACKVTLSHRGDGGTGWSRAWKINFWARLLDGNHSFLLLKNLMVPAGGNPVEPENNGGLYPNLFDAHPPFQIDGNFGAVSGITEMILQSHLRDKDGDYILDILPALPLSLPNGRVKGVCARGGFELEIVWKEGKLEELNILSKLDNPCSVRYAGKAIKLHAKKGGVYSLNAELE